MIGRLNHHHICEGGWEALHHPAAEKFSIAEMI